MGPVPTHTLRDGVRAAVPVIVPTFALAASFGVLARPVMGVVAPIVMSIVVFAGGAQFAALSVLSGGGGAAAAIAAGTLINTRFLPMSFAIAPSLRGRVWRRSAEAQTLVDASFVMADRGDGTFSRELLIGATGLQFLCWTSGTVAGVLASSVIPDPDALGLDAIFPAFYLVLLVGEIRSGRIVIAVALATAITLSLMSFAPPGVPVVAASAAALLGLWRRETRQAA